MKQQYRFVGVCLSATFLAACAGNAVPSTPNSVAPPSDMQLFRSPTSVRSGPLQSGTLSYLYSFAGGSEDGANPNAGLLYSDGQFYGTTLSGGATNHGTVYSITPSGSATLLHSFLGEPDGTSPYAGLVSLNGTIYGTTAFGGTYGDGTVYSITSSGSESVLQNFYAGSGGQWPYGGLIAAGALLYGTTKDGGLYDGGTIFSMSTSGIKTVIHSFGASGDGHSPYSPLLRIGNKLYGTTYGGGENDSGTVYAVAMKSGQETLLHSFGGTGDGAHPYYGRLLQLNGTLYGTTLRGGTHYGTVYSIVPTPSGAYTVVHSFTGRSDGCYPSAGLVRYKKLFYGTTQECGTYGHGTIFSIDPKSNTLTTVWAFGDTPSGRNPFGELIVVNGAIYGTTYYGGADDEGTVFSFVP